MSAQKYFGTTNLYKILGIDSNAEISDGNLYSNYSIFIDIPTVILILTVVLFIVMLKLLFYLYLK